MKSKEQKELEFLRGMEKLNASPIKSPDYQSPLNQDVMKVKSLDVSTPETPDNFKRSFSGVTQKIDTRQSAPLLSGQAFVDKINNLKAAKTLGKKLMGVVPLAGAAGALMSGDPAMAAEELAQDAMGPAGLAYEAIRPEQAGNPEEEMMMLAERDAMENYNNSPAKASKFGKIRASLGNK